MNLSDISPCVFIELRCGGSLGKATLNENMVRVLNEIDSSGSVNKATKRLHMGYSNTLGSIAAIEEALCASLVKRSQGPVGSMLTDDGRHLIGLFECVQEQTQQYADALVSGWSRPQ